MEEENPPEVDLDLNNFVVQQKQEQVILKREQFSTVIKAIHKNGKSYAIKIVL